MEDRDEALRQLMTRYQDGDIEAFEALHQALRPLLTRFFVARVHDAQRADDLLQETFLQVHRARHTYDPAYPVGPWLFAIARHTFFTECRRSRRRHEARHEPLPETLLDSGANPFDGLQARDAVRVALPLLSPASRQAVLLHHVLGLSFEEMAQRLGSPNLVLRARASRGIARLSRAILGETERGRCVARSPLAQGGDRAVEEEEGTRRVDSRYVPGMEL